MSPSELELSYQASQDVKTYKDASIAERNEAHIIATESAIIFSIEKQPRLAGR